MVDEVVDEIDHFLFVVDEVVDEIDHFLFVVIVSSSWSSISMHCSELIEDHAMLLRASQRAHGAT